MAVPSGTTQQVTRVGNREDLADIIYNIDPVETPFISSIGKTNADAVNHEWQTDTLAAADPQNKAIQGDVLANTVRAPTVRLGNYTQIFWKQIDTSSTQMAVKSAGRRDEHAYQIAKAGKELKRDMETRMTGNFAAVPPGTSTAGESAGMQAFLRTNVSRGATGANPTLSGTTSGYPNAAATNGTQRTSTETLLKSVIKLVYDNGGEIKIAMMGTGQKQTFSTFPGIAEQRHEVGEGMASIIGGADIYQSDFGKLTAVPNRFIGTPTTGGSNREIILYDPEYWSVATLDPLKREPLGKQGLSDRDLIFGEMTLRCNNEKSAGIVADLT